MLAEFISFYPLVLIICVLGAFALGVLNASEPVARQKYWVVVIAIFVASKIIDLLFGRLYQQQESEVALLVGLVVQTVAALAIVYFFAQTAAGRAVDAGREKSWAWIVCLPIAGVIWLGVIQESEVNQ